MIYFPKSLDYVCWQWANYWVCALPTSFPWTAQWDWRQTFSSHFLWYPYADILIIDVTLLKFLKSWEGQFFSSGSFFSPTKTQNWGGGVTIYNLVCKAAQFGKVVEYIHTLLFHKQNYKYPEYLRQLKTVVPNFTVKWYFCHLGDRKPPPPPNTL